MPRLSPRARHLTAAVTLLPLLVAGCSASDNPDFGLTPQASIGGANPATALQPDELAQQNDPRSLQQASNGTVGPVQFLPLVGAPPEIAAALSQALGTSAAQNGVTILSSSGPIAPLRLKGYLSTMAEGSGTLVVYVWDIVDPQGKRISRIQGQEKIAATAADPWSIVGQEALARIAAATLADFRQQAAVNG